MNRSVLDANVEAERLGRLVAEQLGDGPSAERLARQREALTALAHQRAERKPWVWVVAAASLSVASVSVVWSSLFSDEAPAVGRDHFVGVTPMLGAAIGDRRLQEHEWLGAASPVTVRLSDGSVVTLAPQARVRLSKLRRDAVQLNVESGSLEAALSELRAQPWSVLAGPFRVEIDATHFSLRWGPEQGHLEVEVESGQLWVSGGTLGAERRRVAAGEKFESAPADTGQLQGLVAAPHLNAEQKHVVSAASPAPLAARRQERPVAGVAPPRLGRSQREAATPLRGEVGSDVNSAADRGKPLESEPVETSPSEVTPTAPSSLGSAPRQPRENQVRSGPSWQQLAEQGRYAEAVEAAEALGFERVRRSSTASELMLLADAARLSGAVVRARATLLEVRQRFPERAGLAAFSLGRLAFDVQRDPAEALRWFEVYLASAPSGPMAQGARARRLQAALQLGDATKVRQAAKDYLEYHPDGALAGRAREVLGDQR